MICIFLYRTKSIQIFNLTFRILKTLSDIYYGQVEHPWAINIEDWKLTQEEQVRINSFQDSLLQRMNAN